MQKYYYAVTYDVCEHEDLFIDMNYYELESESEIESKVREFAKTDIAPVVRVYESNRSDFQKASLYKEFTFKEYECGCSTREGNR